MKFAKKFFLRSLFVVTVVFMAAQNAFALQCEGNIHVKIPSSWSTAYIVIDGSKNLLPKASALNGWYTLSAASFGGRYATSFLFIKDGWNGPGITSQHYDVGGGQGGWKQTDVFTCDDLSAGELYIFENPSKANKTAYSPNPPNAKYLYVMIPPNFEDWMSSVPMISMDGGMTGKPMTADPDKCGWFYYVFFDDKPSDNVFLYRDDDVSLGDIIGVHGNWETSANATPIPLKTMFDARETLGIDTLYFIPDETLLRNPTDDGWYDAFPEDVEGFCSYGMTSIIYDTDASLHGAFTCDSYPENAANGCYVASAPFAFPGKGAAGTVPCIGVTKGIVSEFLDPLAKKPSYNAASGCFASQTAFDVMFKETPGVNAAHCRDVPMTRSSDGMWEYDSYNEPTGAFSILNDLKDSIAAGLCTGTCAIAATLREGKGNVIYGAGTSSTVSAAARAKLGFVTDWSDIDSWSGFPYIDLYPAASGEFSSGSNPDVYDNVTWDERIESANNQMFCLESHGRFIHRPGARFSIRGDDDIWVYIDNRLAVDLGGTHLAAPGYVNLDEFVGMSGSLVSGNLYDIDIFLCDRRTDMTNVRIKTNMFIQQRSGIMVTSEKSSSDNDVSVANICYTRYGSGSCTSMLPSESVECCGNDFLNKIGCQLNMTYYLVQGHELDTENSEILSNGMFHYGGIDLTNPAVPKINRNEVTLPPGQWTLFVKIDRSVKKIASFHQTIKVDVVAGDAVAKYYDEDEKEIVEKRANYEFIKKTIAGANWRTPIDESELVPVYISVVAGEENGKVVLRPDDAVGVSYSLDIPNGMILYKKDVSGNFVSIPYATIDTIGSTGVDTVYAYVSGDILTATSQIFKLKVAGRTTTADLMFYVPRLAFVDTLYKDATGSWVFDRMNLVTGDNNRINLVTGDIDERLIGVDYNFFVIALKPTGAGGSYEFCPECNFAISIGGSSAGIYSLNDEMRIENGGAIIQIRSVKEYRSNKNSAVIVAASPYGRTSSAQYYPIYFTDFPFPLPSFADVFDVKGALPAVPLKIQEPYYKENVEYQDGIADMVDLYFKRPIAKDSLPLAVCIEWDSSSATKFYPVREGVSTVDSESDYILCNAVVKQDDLEVTNCNQTLHDFDGNTIVDSVTMQAVEYCDQRVRMTNLALSEEPKTAGSGVVTVFMEYRNRYGRSARQGVFTDIVVDRIPPMPISAVLSSKTDNKNVDSKLNQIAILMSERVKIVGEDKLNVFDFYVAASGNTGTMNVSMVAPSPDNECQIIAYYKTEDDDGEFVVPREGDFVRLAGSLDQIIWTDKSNINRDGVDSIRALVRANNRDDAYLAESYFWNAPTGYNETKRPVTPWVRIERGTSPINSYTITFLDVDEKTVLSTQELVENEMPEIPTNYTVPAMNAQYTYCFGGWDKEIVAAIENATYTALVDSVLNQYVVDFMYYDYAAKAVVSLYADYFSYGSSVTPPAAPAQTGYIFTGWESDVGNYQNVESDVKVSAVYKAAPTIKFTAKGMNAGSNNLLIEPPSTCFTIKNSVVYDEIGEEMLSINPTFAMEKGESYTWKGVVVTDTSGDCAEDALVRTIVETLTLIDTYNANSAIAIPVTINDVVVIANIAGNAYKYNLEYAFAAGSGLYSVTFANENGSVIEIQKVEEGEMPVAPNSRVDIPKSNAQYTYSFGGWDKRIAAATSNVTYTAKINKTINKYTVSVFVNDAEMGSVTGLSADGIYEYGAKFELTATAAEGYKFSSWDDDVGALAARTVAVTGDASYTANFYKISSSSADDKFSSSSFVESSSSVTDAIAFFEVPQFNVTVSGQIVSFSGATIGAELAIFDLNGGVIFKERVASSNFSVTMPRSGMFVVRSNNQVEKVSIR